MPRKPVYKFPQQWNGDQRQVEVDEVDIPEGQNERDQARLVLDRRRAGGRSVVSDSDVIDALLALRH